MSASAVTLDEVLRAASSRRASLVPETSGYLALAIGDLAARLPFRIVDRAVTLTTEGSVLLERGRDVIQPAEAADALRDILRRLLEVSVGSIPGLAATARARAETDRGMEAVIEELEAALIPVNRAAARRALARLARETLKAKEQGKLRKRGRKATERAAQKAAARANPTPEADPDIPIEFESEAFESPTSPPAPAPVAAATPAAVPQFLGASALPSPEPGPTATAEPTPTIFEETVLPEVIASEASPTVAPEPVLEEEASLFDAHHDAADATIAEAQWEILANGPPLPVPPAPPPPAQPDAEPQMEREIPVPLRATPPAPAQVPPEPEAAIAPRERGPRRPDVRRSFGKERREADLSDIAKSDVDDLLSKFSQSKLGGEDMKRVSAELKMMVGLDATPPPPETAPHTVFMERPAEAPERAPEAPLMSPIMRPGRVSRLGVAMSLALIVIGLAGTALIWRFHPAFFAGTNSGLNESQRLP